MPFTTDALARATAQIIPGCPTPIRFASPEDVILAKLKWYHDGGERSERQYGDLLGMLRVQGEGIDQSYIEPWLDRLAVRDLYTRLCGQV